MTIKLGNAQVIEVNIMAERQLAIEKLRHACDKLFDCTDIGAGNQMAITCGVFQVRERNRAAALTHFGKFPLGEKTQDTAVTIGEITVALRMNVSGLPRDSL